MHIPGSLQFFLNYLANAEPVICHDQLCPIAHLKFRIIYSTRGAYLYRTLMGNIFYAHDKSDMPRYLKQFVLYQQRFRTNGNLSRIRH